MTKRVEPCSFCNRTQSEKQGRMLVEWPNKKTICNLCAAKLQERLYKSDYRPTGPRAA